MIDAPAQLRKDLVVFYKLLSTSLFVVTYILFKKYNFIIPKHGFIYNKYHNNTLFEKPTFDDLKAFFILFYFFYLLIRSTFFIDHFIFMNTGGSSSGGGMGGGPSSGGGPSMGGGPGGNPPPNFNNIVDTRLTQRDPDQNPVALNTVPATFIYPPVGNSLMPPPVVNSLMPPPLVPASLGFNNL